MYSKVAMGVLYWFESAVEKVSKIFRSQQIMQQQVLEIKEDFIAFWLDEDFSRKRLVASRKGIFFPYPTMHGACL